MPKIHLTLPSAIPTSESPLSAKLWIGFLELDQIIRPPSFSGSMGPLGPGRLPSPIKSRSIAIYRTSCLPASSPVPIPHVAIPNPSSLQFLTRSRSTSPGHGRKLLRPLSETLLSSIDPLNLKSQYSLFILFVSCSRRDVSIHQIRDA